MDICCPLRYIQQEVNRRLAIEREVTRRVALEREKESQSTSDSAAVAARSPHAATEERPLATASHTEPTPQSHQPGATCASSNQPMRPARSFLSALDGLKYQGGGAGATSSVTVQGGQQYQASPSSSTAVPSGRKLTNSVGHGWPWVRS